MGKRPATVQSTGGSGFNFEDGVAAFFAVGMLAGTQPLGIDMGGVLQLDWQVDEKGFRLDDLLVTVCRPEKACFSLSVKSNRQVAGAGFPRDFVERMWRQTLARGADGELAMRPLDLCGLAVGQIGGAVQENWETLLEQALITDPERIAERFTTGSASAAKKKLFASLRCPVDVSASVSDVDVARLIRQIRLCRFDVLSPTSTTVRDAVTALQRVVVSGSLQDAQKLWNALVTICATRRPGGTLTPEELWRQLRDKHSLRDRPDFAAQWERVEKYSREQAARVKTTIGDTYRIDRHEAIGTLRQTIGTAGSVWVAGPSGSGKSAVARLLAEDSTFCSRFVWLNAESVGSRTPSELQHALKLDVPLAQLFAQSSPSLSMLVLDGLDRFSDEGLKTVFSLLPVGGFQAGTGWVLVATSRTDTASNVSARLRQLAVGSVPSLWILAPPGAALVKQVLRDIPRLSHLAPRPQLHAALQNLKILDWIASRSVSDDESNAWIGHIDVIDWVWGSWLGTGADRLARGGILKKMGLVEAEHLSSGIGLGQLSGFDHLVLEELARTDVVRVEGERVYFAHDLIGDVARLRTLMEFRPEELQGLLDRAKLPTWHAAIRLWGQALAERSSPHDSQWNRMFETIPAGSTEGEVVRDRLVEGIALAANAEQLLETLWPHLLADNGAMLVRFLQAFRFVATTPHPGIKSLKLDGARCAEVEARVRQPLWYYWLPLLRVLAANAEELARVRPVEVGEVLVMWLSQMHVDMPGRKDAARAALAIAQELRAARAADRWGHHDNESVVFEAVLCAAPELPDEVEALSLELAQRRPAPPAVLERCAEAAKKREMERAVGPRIAGNRRIVHDEGELVPAAADGPMEQVDDAFQHAVLSGQSIGALASVRPNAAREVLLACSLQPPYRRGFGIGIEGLQYYGTESPDRSSPPFYSNGPWLALLQQNPGLGIECVIRLVNQATDAWRGEFAAPGSRRGGRQAPPPVHVFVDGEDRWWNGDEQVFQWYRKIFVGGNTLVSALMALERWLYEMLDAEQEVDTAIAQVWRSSSSVAVLGVLSAVACRNPDLLDGPLAPLLGVWQLSAWGHRVAMNSNLWSMNRHDEAMVTRVQEWNAQPHRKAVAVELFIQRFLSRQSVRQAFDSIRERWAKEALSSPESQAIRRLIARFDIANYSLEEVGEGKATVRFAWPADLADETNAAAAKAELAMASIAFPLRCRQALDLGTPLSDSEAAKWWEELQQFASADLPPGRDEIDAPAKRMADIVMGGVAVLMLLAKPWLHQDGERAAWCEEQVAAVIQQPPPIGMFDVPNSHSTDCWHSFLAEVLVDELAADPDREVARRLVAEIIMGRWHATTKVAMQAAYRRRNDLGQDFARLVNLVTLSAALRATQCVPDENDRVTPALYARREASLVTAFERKTLPASRLDWMRVGRIGHRAYMRSLRKRFPTMEDAPGDSEQPRARNSRRGRRRTNLFRRSTPFDQEFLVAGYSWLEGAPCHSPGGDAAVVDAVRALVSISLDSPAGQENTDEEDGDDALDNLCMFAFDRAADIILQAESDALARDLWQPILQRGPTMERRLENFLTSWFIAALKASSSKKRFFERWRQMIAFAETHPAWSTSDAYPSSALREAWRNLLGMGLVADAIAPKEHEGYFVGMVASYERWAGRCLDNAAALNDFSVLLSEPGARALRLPALPWLAKALAQIDGSRRAQGDLGVQVVRVLRLAWSEASAAITAKAESRLAFQEALALLVVSQSPDALHLRDAVVGKLASR